MRYALVVYFKNKVYLDLLNSPSHIFKIVYSCKFIIY